MTLNFMEKAVIMILDSVCFFSNEIWNQNLADEARLMVTFWFMLNTFHDFMLIIQFLTQLHIHNPILMDALTLSRKAF